jgi:DNA-directed RNA polymerase specialized sigma24 family protein
MEHLQTPRLLDERGHPLSERIEGALRSLVPKFRRRYPDFQDELQLTTILEKAGQRIAIREEQSGPIEKLHAYAWVTLKNIATSCMRLGSNRLEHQSVGSEASAAILAKVPAEFGSPQQIEREILLRQAMSHLTQDEWLVCSLKMLGYSGEEIASRRGSSTAAVNMVFSRATKKLRALLNGQSGTIGDKKPGGGAQ